MIFSLFFCVILLEKGDAQEKFPRKPVTLIIPYGAGGGTDIFARGIQPFVEKYLGTELVMENRPGGGGIIGYTKLWNAKPDGYTIGTCNLRSFVAGKMVFNPKYECDKFTPIAAWANMPMCLFAHADAFDSFKQFIETARKRKLTVGQAGGARTSVGYLQSLIMEKAVGIELKKVPYKKSGQVPVAVAGKHIDSMIGISASAVSFVKSGELRPLVTFYEQRDLLYPEVPTPRELGYKFPVLPLLRGVIGPPNTPRDRVKILEAAFIKAAKDPEYLELAKKMNIIVGTIGSKAYAEKIKEGFEFLEPFSDLLKKK
jgi:tripartite-type tricarboxylate transporter receptor subunit TctC